MNTTQQQIIKALNNGLTQTRMADIVGMSQSSIHRYLSGALNDMHSIRIESALGEYLAGVRLEYAGEVYYLRGAA